MNKNHYGKTVWMVLKRASIYLLRCCIIAWIFSCFLYAVEKHGEIQRYALCKKITNSTGWIRYAFTIIRAMQQSEQKYTVIPRDDASSVKEINVKKGEYPRVFPILSKIDYSLFKPFDVVTRKGNNIETMIYGQEGGSVCNSCFCAIIGKDDYSFYQKEECDDRDRVAFCLNCILAYHIPRNNLSIMYTREEYRKAHFRLLDDYQKAIGVSPVKEVNDIILDYSWQPFNEQEAFKDYPEGGGYVFTQYGCGELKIVPKNKEVVNDEQKRAEEAPVKEEVWDKKIGIFLVIGAVILIGGVVVYKKSKKKRGVLPKQESTSLRYR